MVCLEITLRRTVLKPKNKLENLPTHRFLNIKNQADYINIALELEYVTVLKHGTIIILFMIL